MKKLNLVYLSMLIMFSISLSSCEAIGSIFKAGMWVGIIGIVLVVLIVIWLINKVKNKD